MKRLVVVVAAIFVLVVARTSSARTTSTPLPLDGEFPALVADDDGVVVVGTRAHGAKSEVVAIRFDVAKRRIVRTASIAETPSQRAVAAAKSGERIVVVTGGLGLPDAIEIFELDASLRVVRHEEIGRGMLPSIAVVDAWIVTAFFEEREPVAVRDASTGFVPSFAMHVQVRDRRGLAVHGARIFRGEALLAPHMMPPRGGHVVAPLGARVVVSVPEVRKATLRALRLPSLDTEQQLVVDRADTMGSTPVHAIGGAVIAAGDALLELSPSLQVVSRHPVEVVGNLVARDARTGRIATDARPASPAWRAAVSFYGLISASDLAWTAAGAVAVGADEAHVPRIVLKER